MNFSKISEARKIFILTFISLFIVAIYASTFYPGYLTADSLFMLSQATGKSELTNWHPTFLVLLWGELFSIFKSAGGIWLMQISIFVFSLAYFSLKMNNFLLSLISLIGISLFPALFSNLGALWKDCWAIISCFICLIFSMRSGQEKTIEVFWLVYISAAATALIRIDYLIIVLPFLIYTIIYGIPSKYGIINRRKFTFLLFIFFGFFYIAGKVVQIPVQQKLNSWIPIAVWDVAGTNYYANDKSGQSGYTCHTSDPLVFGENRALPLNLPEQPLIKDVKAESSEIFGMWIQTITSNPVAYITHRLCVGRTFFGISPANVHYPFPRSEFLKNEYTQVSDRSLLNLDLYWFFDSHAQSYLYRYWVYISLSILIIIVALTTRTITPFSFVIIASIFFSAARFIILPAADFRYGLWICLGTLTLLAFSLNSLIAKNTRN